jgi:hypothetical protein
VAVSFIGEGPGENHRPVASHRQTLSHNVVHLALNGVRTHNISGELDHKQLINKLKIPKTENQENTKLPYLDKYTTKLLVVKIKFICCETKPRFTTFYCTHKLYMHLLCIYLGMAVLLCIYLGMAVLLCICLGKFCQEEQHCFGILGTG